MLGSKISASLMCANLFTIEKDVRELEAAGVTVKDEIARDLD